MTKGFISSEESGEEALKDGEKRQILIVKQILWRSPKINCFFFRVNSRLEKSKSAQAKQQTRQRVIGRYSTGTKPAVYSSDFYGFVVA